MIEYKFRTVSELKQALNHYPDNALAQKEDKKEERPKKLIEAAMRMKPDHIFLAELRADEAWSYLEALNTGHEGSTEEMIRLYHSHTVSQKMMKIVR